MNPHPHTLIGPYVLDALEDTERELCERHLAECTECAREERELRATTTRLASAVATEPPVELRARVMAQLARNRQDPPPATGGRGIPGRRPPTRLLGAVAAVLLAVSLTLGVVTYRTQEELHSAQQRLAEARARYTPIAAVLTAPDARITNLAGPGGSTVTVIVSRGLDQAVLMVAGMPSPPPSHDYQAWLIGTDQPRPAGLIRPDPNTRATPLLLTGLAESRKVGVTVEQLGGSEQPTSPPIMLLDLPA